MWPAQCTPHVAKGVEQPSRRSCQPGRQMSFEVRGVPQHAREAGDVSQHVVTEPFDDRQRLAIGEAIKQLELPPRRLDELGLQHHGRPQRPVLCIDGHVHQYTGAKLTPPPLHAARAGGTGAHPTRGWLVAKQLHQGFAIGAVEIEPVELGRVTAGCAQISVPHPDNGIAFARDVARVNDVIARALGRVVSHGAAAPIPSSSRMGA
jgi:hypothetical protein